MPENEEIICALGGAKRLGRLRYVDPLDGASLRETFDANFNIADFR